MSLRKLTRLLFQFIVSVVLFLAIAWSAAAIWIDGPDSTLITGILVAAVLVIALLVAVYIRPWRRMAAVWMALFAVVLFWWLLLEPRNDRDWLPDVAQLATASLDGSILTVRNVRNFDYQDENTYTERWQTRRYDLDKLVGLDIFFSFWGPTLYGHTIMSWEFADGKHLAVSIETRKEKGEEYSAVRGFFRQFELYYVVADENDVIRLRTNYRKEDVKLYRLAAKPEAARKLLLDYVEEMNKLAAKPRWYNALTHNCTTTIWHHVKAVGTGHPFDWRLLANGYLVDLSYERGSVNTDYSLEEFKQRSDITARARAANNAVDFSRVIREGLPTRPSRLP